MAKKIIYETIWDIAGDGHHFNDYPAPVIDLLDALVNFAGTGEENCQQARRMALDLVKYLQVNTD